MLPWILLQTLKAQQIPNIWSFEYQMGPGPYARCLAENANSSVAPGRAWTEADSPFSDHIHVFLSLMRSKSDPTILLSKSTIDQQEIFRLPVLLSMPRSMLIPLQL